MAEAGTPVVALEVGSALVVVLPNGALIDPRHRDKIAEVPT
jgi:hypothetical protein